MKSEWKAKKPIGILCLSNFGGLLVLDLECGIEDKIITCFDFGSGRKHFGKNKIRYNSNGDAYFVKFGKRYYLNEIMRTN
jgi:hypothetical protein